MALNILKFEFDTAVKNYTLPAEWSHTGVVGSGDMEVLLRSVSQGGRVTVTVTTPVNGFDDVWEKVLGKFVSESGIGDIDMEINDNNSMPFVVVTRLKQAFAEAKGVV